MGLSGAVRLVRGAGRDVVFVGAKGELCGARGILKDISPGNVFFMLCPLCFYRAYAFISCAGVRSVRRGVGPPCLGRHDLSAGASRVRAPALRHKGRPSWPRRRLALAGIRRRF